GVRGCGAQRRPRRGGKLRRARLRAVPPPRLRGRRERAGGGDLLGGAGGVSPGRLALGARGGAGRSLPLRSQARGKELLGRGGRRSGPRGFRPASVCFLRAGGAGAAGPHRVASGAGGTARGRVRAWTRSCASSSRARRSSAG